ncbi:hypothetical protein CRI94_16500 [Longibacter salinarum]|uniref:Uncharacterized protein n=1 Tax=Longibacter salinarum TaxID=1850348 RepID=A0A2A8CUI4_9BACT|nr:hypothetical protein CRI94_16500 [Longibacter salinarum]
MVNVIGGPIKDVNAIDTETSGGIAIRGGPISRVASADDLGVPESVEPGIESSRARGIAPGGFLLNPLPEFSNSEPVPIADDIYLHFRVGRAYATVRLSGRSECKFYFQLGTGCRYGGGSRPHGQ